MRDYKGKWCIARVHMVFPKLKGCIKTKSGKRFISPGERFMPLKEELEFTYFGDMVERPFGIIEEGGRQMSRKKRTGDMVCGRAFRETIQ